MEQLPLGLKVPDSARFATFWPGPNAGAVDFVAGLTGAGRDIGAWLWGAPGVGKTHLLQAACRAADQAGLDTGYLPLEIVSDAGARVFDGWGPRDLVAVDDIDVVAGQPDRERALFRLYNELAEKVRKVGVS